MQITSFLLKGLIEDCLDSKDKDIVEPILNHTMKGLMPLATIFREAMNEDDEGDGGEYFDSVMRGFITESGSFLANTVIGMLAAVMCAQFRIHPTDFHTYESIFINRISNSIKEKQLIITLMSTTYSKLDSFNDL